MTKAFNTVKMTPMVSFFSECICIYEFIHTNYSTKTTEAVLLYIKLAIISKIKQSLLKKLHEHTRQTLIIKASMRLSNIAHIS